MTKGKEMIRPVVLMMALLMTASLPSTITGQERDRSVFTNAFADNWQLSFGAEDLSFFSSREDGMGLSSSPFSAYRSTFGANLTVGKWFTPELGLRTRASGYWGRTILGKEASQNSSRFFAVEEQVMLSMRNMILGYNPDRFWDIIPYGGVGFVRNCSYKENSVGLSLGVNNTFRLSRQMGAYIDLGVTFAGDNYNKDGEATVMGRYHWFHLGLGLTFNIGRNIWSRHASRQNKVVYLTGREGLNKIDMLRADYMKVIADSKVPVGMVLVERGHVRMGIEAPDELWGKTPVRDISVDDFYMDCTEVTNRQYREFLQEVLDSVVSQRAPLFEGDRRKAKESLYTVNPITGERRIDTKPFLYRYETYDHEAEMKRRYRTDPAARGYNTDLPVDESVQTITKDTAYITADGRVVREKITRPYTGAYDFLNTYIVNVYPDTTCWVNDFPGAVNARYARYYFWHPDYQDYPVVGVTWEQANAYCAWRTERMRRVMGDDYRNEQPFRLPTEAEWEYAARGKTRNEFPWVKEAAGYGTGAVMANFMPDRGDYTKDGNVITSRVGIYRPNTMGLYDMAGNVAEWTSTHYTAAGVEAMNNINPELQYSAAENDPYNMKRKSVRGGSWKDPESHIRSAWRSYEYQNRPRCYIGFRCVRSVATTPSENAVIIVNRK